MDKKVVERNRRLIRTYGITAQEYDALWQFQAGRCAVCGIALRRYGSEIGVRAEVDHDHAKHLKPRQAVRGLLCGGRWKGCNRKIGNMDQVSWLEKVIAYLKDPPAQKFLRGL